MEKEIDVKKNLRNAISAFCRWRIERNMCSQNDCDFCPVNRAYNMARERRYAVDIVWDTDGVSIDDLPEKVEVPDDIDDDDIADYLSDVHGWCVEGFCVDQKQD